MVFSCKFATYFQKMFLQEYQWVLCNTPSCVKYCFTIVCNRCLTFLVKFADLNVDLSQQSFAKLFIVKTLSRKSCLIFYKSSLVVYTLSQILKSVENLWKHEVVHFLAKTESNTRGVLKTKVVLKNSCSQCSETCQVTFAAKILEKISTKKSIYRKVPG